MKGRVSELDYFVGAWRADVKDPASGKHLEMSYSIEPVLGGAWYAGTGRAGELEIHDLWGKDPVTGEIVRSIFDSNGTYGTVRSRGWGAETLIFEGEAATPGGKAAVRETITRVGPDQFNAVWEELRDGAWTAYSVEVLKRVR